MPIMFVDYLLFSFPEKDYDMIFVLGIFLPVSMLGRDCGKGLLFWG
uniref:Uncharacterized protein n=1 Tax=Rhizophora mucronata TaxID=61149 RepID=A0A2P2PXH4_RHIMU